MYVCMYVCMYVWLCWVFIAAHGLSLVAASRGYSSLQCVGFSLRWLLLWRSTGSRAQASVVVAHWLSCSTTCGIFLDQGSNPCPLHWQADSLPLRHQGSPTLCILKKKFFSNVTKFKVVSVFAVEDHFKYG